MATVSGGTSGAREGRINKNCQASLALARTSVCGGRFIEELGSTIVLPVFIEDLFQ